MHRGKAARGLHSRIFTRMAVVDVLLTMSNLSICIFFFEYCLYTFHPIALCLPSRSRRPPGFWFPTYILGVRGTDVRKNQNKRRRKRKENNNVKIKIQTARHTSQGTAQSLGPQIGRKRFQNARLSDLVMLKRQTGEPTSRIFGSLTGCGLSWPSPHGR